MTSNSSGSGGALLLLIVVMYFLPGIVASTRRHANRLAIGVLNIFLGWTVLGWIAALVWACTSNVEPRQERPARRSTGLIAFERRNRTAADRDWDDRHTDRQDPRIR